MARTAPKKGTCVGVCNIQVHEAIQAMIPGGRGVHLHSLQKGVLRPYESGPEGPCRSLSRDKQSQNRLLQVQLVGFDEFCLIMSTKQKRQ